MNQELQQHFFDSQEYKEYFKKKGITSYNSITQENIAFLTSNKASHPHRYYGDKEYYKLNNNTLKTIENELIVNMFNNSNINLISNNNLNKAFFTIINNIDDLAYQLKGIYNFGNTCYFNISIQLLLRCTDIVKLLLQNNNIYLKLFLYYYFINFYTTISQEATILLLKELKFPNTQEDPDECILLFLEGGQLGSIDIYKIINDNIFNEIKNILYFKMNEYNLNNTFITSDQLMLRLHLSSKDFKKIFINHFINNNSIIYDLKQYFFIMFNRINLNGSKIEKEILNIPKLLSISIGENFYNYKLIAFNMHFGSSSKSGHYIAFKEINGLWYKFNDSNVSEEKNVDNNLKKSSILGYELINNKKQNNYFKLPTFSEDLKNTKFINNKPLKKKSKKIKSIPIRYKFSGEEIETIKKYIIPFVKKIKSK